MNSPPVNSVVFRLLCRVLGGQDPAALSECVAARWLPDMFEMAYWENVLPALAVRCNEQGIDDLGCNADKASALRLALMENTLRIMMIKVQALKITRQLNRAGITPLFLKGTASLLSAEHENLGFRKQVDIDLLVAPSQLKAAGDVFLAEGYQFQWHSGGTSARPTMLADTERAMKLSAAHHHLPALVKDGYATTVELHKHHLPNRFQRDHLLEPLLGNARQCTTSGATFLVPSVEHQIIHIVFGKLVNDGYFARRSFPIREACDLIDLLGKSGGRIDQEMIERHCGKKFQLFHALVVELMAYRSPIEIEGDANANASSYIRMMCRRLDSKLVRTLLNTTARIDYLSHELAYSPAKLPDYLRRVMSA
jgi:Uncharacterised nucleotidyltransferase